MTYLDPDDARSDFFLAAVVYVIGPTVLALALRFVPFLAVPVVLSVVVPFLTTAAMPLYLLRYREGSARPLLTGGGGAAAKGLLVAAPLVVGAVAAGALRGELAQLPLLTSPLAVVAVTVRWLSLAVLAVFLWLRAEHAFRPISELQHTLVRQAGLAAAGTAVVATLLLLLAGASPASLLVVAGLAGVVLLAEGQLPQSGMGERWWAWAPVITLAFGPLELFGVVTGGTGFLTSAQRAAAAAVLGVVVVRAMHRRTGALAAFGAAAGFALAALVAGGAGALLLV